jgi:hypothetical protein
VQSPMVSAIGQPPQGDSGESVADSTSATHERSADAPTPTRMRPTSLNLHDKGDLLELRVSDPQGGLGLFAIELDGHQRPRVVRSFPRPSS